MHGDAYDPTTAGNPYLWSNFRTFRSDELAQFRFPDSNTNRDVMLAQVVKSIMDFAGTQKGLKETEAAIGEEK